MTKTIGETFLKELEAELGATRHCLERIPESLYDYKPHEKSMVMKNLVAVVSEIPKWIAAMIEVGEINFTTWEKYTPTTTADNLKRFDENVEKARAALKNVSDAALNDEIFYLKMGEQVLMKDPKGDSISSTINHLVHHRGQLTVYMRLNNIAVPKIYGPSADEQGF